MYKFGYMFQVDLIHHSQMVIIWDLHMVAHQGPMDPHTVPHMVPHMALQDPQCMALPGAIHMGHPMVMDLQGLRVGHTWDLRELNPGDRRECHLTADLRVLQGLTGVQVDPQALQDMRGLDSSTLILRVHLEVPRVHPAEDPLAMALTRDPGR